MRTYLIRREPGRRTPLADIMQDIPSMPDVPESIHYEVKRNGAHGPVRSLLRRQLEAMNVGDVIETHERTPSQVSAIAFHVRRMIPEARYRCKQRDGVTVVWRVS